MMLRTIYRKKKDYSTDKQSEKPMRSIVKSFSWRVVGTIDTVLISWLITGEIKYSFFNRSVELGNKNDTVFLS